MKVIFIPEEQFLPNPKMESVIYQKVGQKEFRGQQPFRNSQKIYARDFLLWWLITHLDLTKIGLPSKLVSLCSIDSHSFFWGLKLVTY